MNPSKQVIIEAAARLFEKQGFNATGVNEIIRESGAPKGSLYYYFPEGKEQIGVETVEWAANQTIERICFGFSQAKNEAEAIRLLVYKIAEVIEESKSEVGGPLMILAAETAAGSQRINEACQEAYLRIQAVFCEKLNLEANLSQFIVASLEGAILLSRVKHNGDPLRLAGDYLVKMIEMEEVK